MKYLHRLFLGVAAAAFFVASAVAQTPGTVTSRAFAIGKGAGQTGFDSVLCTQAQLAIGQNAAKPICAALSGDVTMDASGVTAIGSAKVTSAMLRNSAALSVIGRSANSTGVPADISCSAGSDAVLRESGSTLGCGTIATAGIANNAVTLAKLATQAANTTLANATSGAAVPTAFAMPSCSTSASALQWTTNSGFGCNTAISVSIANVTGLGTGVGTALGVNVGTAGAFVVNGGALGTPASGTVTNLTGTASININGTVGATTPNTSSFTSAAYSTTLTGTSTNASSLAVGRQGATNPVLQVDSSVASQAAGLKITGGATGNGVALATIDSGTNSELSINAKGSGQINIGNSSTGAVSVAKVTITAPASSATLTIPDGVTLTGPASSGTAMTLGNTETVTGVKTFGSAGAVGRLKVAGTTSGSTVLDASATASGTLTLPAATDTLVGKATTDTFTNKTFNSSATGNTLQVSGVTVSNGQYPGEPSNSDATAGNVGEYLEQEVLSGSAVSLTTVTPANMTSRSYTAGDWDIGCSVVFTPSASPTALFAALNTTSATLPAAPNKGAYFALSLTYPSATAQIISTGSRRYIFSSTTTVYCVVQGTFASGTMTAYGVLWGRRRR